MSRTQGDLRQIESDRLLNDENRAELKRLNETIEKVTLSIFGKLTHDETGRYSDDGVHFNAIGADKQEQLLTTGNAIRYAMEVLSKL